MAKEEIKDVQQALAKDLWLALNLEPRSFDVIIESEGFATIWAALIERVRKVHGGR